MKMWFKFTRLLDWSGVYHSVKTHKIYNWALTWKVTFNASKSKDIIFSKSLLPSHPTILGLQFIERVHLHKHLGLYINSSLTWDKQIESIVKKVNFKLSIMWQVKELSRQCLDLITCQVFHRLCYNCVWSKPQ